MGFLGVDRESDCTPILSRATRSNCHRPRDLILGIGNISDSEQFGDLRSAGNLERAGIVVNRVLTSGQRTANVEERGEDGDALLRSKIVRAQCRGRGGSELFVDLGDEVALQKAQHDCARHDEAEGEERRNEADELGGKRTTLPERSKISEWATAHGQSSARRI